MNKEVSLKLIHKYMEGKCSAEELDLLYSWYESMDTSPDPLEMLSFEDKSVLRKLMLDRIKNKISPIDNHTETRSRPPILRRLIYTVSGIAALLILILGVNFLRNYEAPFPNSSKETVVTNLTKKMYKQILSDGSIVWLNPQSRLEFPQNFTGPLREVKMKGEAFFEVTKDHKHPFVIYSGGIVTRVWGTSFRIKTYGEFQTEVSVITGRVSVKIPRSKDAEVMLFPDQKVTYLKKKDLLKKEQEKPFSTMSMWKKTNLSFDNVPLSAVILILNKRFGYEISTADDVLRKYVLKADFNNESLPDILELLEKSLNVNYKMNDRKITLIRKLENPN